MLGYGGAVLDTDIATAKAEGQPELRPSCFSGKAGLEEVNDSYLRGTPGIKQLAVDNAGRPHVLLSDRKGRSRLHLAVNEMDAGNLIVIGPEGNVVAGIGVSDDGRPWLRPLTGDEAPSQTEKPDAKAKVPGNDGKGDPDPSAEKKLEAPVEALPIRRD